MKKAVLAVSFGTTHKHTREANLDVIEQALAQHLPDYTVYRAFTSGMVMRRIQELEGIHIDNTAEALQRLAQDGYRSVLIQPTHVLCGEEHEKVLHAAHANRALFEEMTFGAPLLSCTLDMQEVVKALAEGIQTEPEEALVLMGHGANNFSNAAYAALDYMFKEAGYKHVFVGAVEGYPELPVVLRQLKETLYKKVCLAPLMVVAGDHATNDMAGDEEDSWKSILTQEGYEVRCVVKGLGEYPAIREIYIRHALEAK